MTQERAARKAPETLHENSPICVLCLRNYWCELNEVLVRIGPEEIIEADLWKCRECGHLLVRGFAERAASAHSADERYRQAFERKRKLMGDHVLTDYEGHPIEFRNGPFRLHGDDAVPPDEVREAAANQEHRW